MLIEQEPIDRADDLDDDFEAGFSQAGQTKTPDPAEETPEAEAPPEVELPKLAQITEAQFQELLAKASLVDEMKADSQRKFDNAFGQLGGLKQTVERFNSPNSTPVQVGEEDFSEMNTEFPELAGMQAKGLNRVLAKLRGGGTVDAAAIQQIVTQQTAEYRADSLDRLNDIVEDWESKRPDIQAWVATQPDAVKALADSENVRDAASLLRQYRAAKSQPVEIAKPAVTTRQRQLEAAVTPRSARGAAPEPGVVDDFEEGFNSVRR